MVKVFINNREFHASEGESMLSVARRMGIFIPALCYEESLSVYGACRLCLVEVLEGDKEGVTTSCTLRAKDGLKIVTDTPNVEKYRKILLELYLAQAPDSPIIKRLAEKYGVKKTRFAKKINLTDPLRNRCILCGLCVRVCSEIIGAGAINYIGRGQYTEINTPFFEKSSVCEGCGACAEVCPSDAIEIEDKNSVRVMKSWSNTDVLLKQCKMCGKYFAPDPFMQSVYDKLDIEIDEELKELCPDCRRKLISKKEILSPKGEWHGIAKR